MAHESPDSIFRKLGESVENNLRNKTMTHKNVRECCEKCWITEMLDYSDIEGNTYMPVSEPFCCNPDCKCHQNTQEEKTLEHAERGIKEFAAKSELWTDPTPPQPPIQEDIADHFEDVEIAILELAQAVEDGAWNGVYKRVYEILRPLTKE